MSTVGTDIVVDGGGDDDDQKVKAVLYAYGLWLWLRAGRIVRVN